MRRPECAARRECAAQGPAAGGAPPAGATVPGAATCATTRVQQAGSRPPAPECLPWRRSPRAAATTPALPYRSRTAPTVSPLRCCLLPPFPTLAAPDGSRNWMNALPYCPLPTRAGASAGTGGRGTTTRSTVPWREHSSWMSASTCTRGGGEGSFERWWVTAGSPRGERAAAAAAAGQQGRRPKHAQHGPSPHHTPCPRPAPLPSPCPPPPSSTCPGSAT